MSKDYNGMNAEQRQEGPVFHIDVGGVKARLTPSGPRTSAPGSWWEVVKNVNDDLKLLIVGLSGLLADLPDGIRRMWRGATGIPSAITTRIKGRRVKARQKEQAAEDVLEEHVRLLLESLENYHSPFFHDPGTASTKKLPHAPGKTLPSGSEASS